MRLKIDKMEHFHHRNIGQIGHFFMNFHYARYKKVKKTVPPNIKNEASDHLNEDVPKSQLHPNSCQYPLINYLFDTTCLIPLCMESIWLFNLNEEVRDFEHKLQVYLFSLCTSK